MTEASANILLVEDDGELLEILTYVLEDEGHRVMAAADGDSALKMARTEAFDAVILDISMAGMDGCEVGRALRSDPVTAGVLIAVHTALSEEEVRKTFADYDLFLAKRDDADALCKAIDDMIQSRRATLASAGEPAAGELPAAA